MLKPKKSAIPVYTLNIITEESEQRGTKSVAKKDDGQSSEPCSCNGADNTAADPL